MNTELVKNIPYVKEYKMVNGEVVIANPITKHEPYMSIYPNRYMRCNHKFKHQGRSYFQHIPIKDKQGNVVSYKKILHYYVNTTK